MKLRTGTRTILGALAAGALFMPVTHVAQANEVTPSPVFTNPLTVPASGVFSFTTNPGILTTWESAGISVIGIAPGSVITSSQSLNARITLPVVAKTGTANATSGGFRLLNSETGVSVRCQVPTVDTRARVVECILADGTRDTFFVITDIAQKLRVVEGVEMTSFFRGIDLSFLNMESATKLNRALSTNVFSASVSVARGEMEVTRVIPRP
jgi:hypothetical protein